MILYEFPDLKWLKMQAETRFNNKKGWKNQILNNTGWPTVILNTNTSNIYRDNIRGPLSLFCNLSGESIVHVDKKTAKIKTGFFYITNHDQHYTLEVDKKMKAETFNIHFGEHFADEAMSSLQSPERLLDHEFSSPLERVDFYNTLQSGDQIFYNHISALKNSSNDKLSQAENLYTLLIYVLDKNNLITKTQSQIPALKNTTRQEIMKRLLYSKDFIYSSYDKNFDLDDLASAACLSKFHFLRLFKIAFGKTPNQFITEVRIQKAKELLKHSSIEINVIARSLGFENSSSFSRRFYQQVGVYPSQFKSA
jgi:AraC family transcriptional regulator